MCGIFGYAGLKNSAGKIVANGLKRLDYRGYDSWGIALCADNSIRVQKEVGKISEAINLDFLPSSQVAIAHTRWATTGEVSKVNAHPHLSTDKKFALAQNGIVENYLDLKADLLKKGYRFISQTDTEVITRLVEDKMKFTKDMAEAVRLAFKDLSGRNTIIMITADGKIIAARNGSPLIVGINLKENETYLSSDTLSISEYAEKMAVINNGQMIIVDKDVTVRNINTGNRERIDFRHIEIKRGLSGKGSFDHFMLKEIYEGPEALKRLIKQGESNLKKIAKAIKQARNVYTIGSGGAGVAAAQVAFYLRRFGKIPAVSLIGADAMEYVDLLSKNDLMIAISQSGETADVLEILELAKKKKVMIASFVNMPGSMITQLSDFPFMSESGPEICVMSTKTFDAQVVFGYLLAKTMVGKYKEARINVLNLANKMERYLNDKNNHTLLKSVAKKIVKKHDIFLLGKYQNFQIIREGMVKIIEASYKHGHALPAGDLKHYVITLMEPGVVTIAVISNDFSKRDVLNAVDEVHLRGATVIGIGPENYKNFDMYLPVPDTGESAGIMNLIPLQLISYYMAVELGNNIDKPRNIAKSVTVK